MSESLKRSVSGHCAADDVQLDKKTKTEQADRSAELEEEEVDWRDQNYYWRGMLSYDTDQQRLWWKGSWLGSFGDAPSVEAFEGNHNNFEYSSRSKTTESDVTRLFGANIFTGNVEGGVGTDFGSSSATPAGSVGFRGFYLMDNDGKGKYRKYRDEKCALTFRRGECSKPNGDKKTVMYVVGGYGDTEFGPFKLSGTYDSGTGVLKVVRQYTKDD
jgi:hypothetical protein